MTEAQTHTFDNLGVHEHDHYKGKPIFARRELISYQFTKHFDEHVTDGKKQYADRSPVVWIHDFNNYTHGEGSGHNGNPYNNGECVAVDYEFKRLSLFEAFMLAIKWRFNGIFVYPFDRKGNLSTAPFIHADWKDWDRPTKTTTFGYRDRKGNMVTCNGNFDEVVQLLSMLPEMMVPNGDPLNGVD
ncbi:MAG: hypothetical protein JXQ30_08690 [Spirochaetes bacterium]|nr:hypothetical protein [Spirochaetota bacterium]